MNSSALDAIDRMMMQRCIALSREAASAGEYPFACVIAKGAEVLVETTNRVARDGDVTRHAELLAVSEAQRKLGRRKLTRCTLYTTVEPCPMCSFPIREAGIGRVVYAIGSPLMGGHSRWNILGDPALSAHMPELFGDAPKVIAGLLRKEAETVWWRTNWLAWGVIRLRGIFGRCSPPGPGPAIPPLPSETFRVSSDSALQGRPAADRPLIPHLTRSGPKHSRATP
jgi:tRNA(adenine34) deaminase